MPMMDRKRKVLYGIQAVLLGAGGGALLWVMMFLTALFWEKEWVGEVSLFITLVIIGALVGIFVWGLIQDDEEVPF